MKVYKRRRGGKASSKWHADYFDAQGIRRRVALSPDKQASVSMLNDILAQVHRERAGLLTPADKAGKRPLVDHIADWRRALEAKGNTVAHARLSAFRVRRLLIDECQFTFLREIRLSTVQEALSALIEREGLSLQTLNYHVTAAKGFCRWLAKDRRLPDNPLIGLAGQNVRLDRRHDRRTLSDGELARLLEATRGGPVVFGLSGEDRRALYLVALGTGLRASELASLTPASFDLRERTVTVEASYSKRRRLDVLPLSAELVKHLQDWLADRPKGEPCWRGRWKANAAEMVRVDLASAKIEYRTEDGVFDMHAMRHQFCTALAKANVPPTIAQQLARHSTIELTLGRYAHVGLIDMRGAVDALPSIPNGCPSTPEPARATGTDGEPIEVKPAEKSGQQNGAKQPAFLTLPVSSDCTMTPDGDNGQSHDETSQKQGKTRENRSGQGETRTRTRVSATRILSPSDDRRNPLGNQGLTAKDTRDGQQNGAKTEPNDPGFEQLASLWNALDEPARQALLSVAKSMAKR